LTLARLIADRRNHLRPPTFLKASADPCFDSRSRPAARRRWKDFFFVPFPTYRFVAFHHRGGICAAPDDCRVSTPVEKSSNRPAHSGNALETVTIASLVEKKKTGRGPRERRRSSPAYSPNRIAKGMRLDCGPDDDTTRPLLDNRYTGVIHKSDLFESESVQHLSERGPAAGPDRESRFAASLESRTPSR